MDDHTKSLAQALCQVKQNASMLSCAQPCHLCAKLKERHGLHQQEKLYAAISVASEGSCPSEYNYIIFAGSLKFKGSAYFQSQALHEAFCFERATWKFSPSATRFHGTPSSCSFQEGEILDVIVICVGNCFHRIRETAEAEGLSLPAMKPTMCTTSSSDSESGSHDLHLAKMYSRRFPTHQVPQPIEKMLAQENQREKDVRSLDSLKEVPLSNKMMIKCRQDATKGSRSGLNKDVVLPSTSSSQSNTVPTQPVPAPLPAPAQRPIPKPRRSKLSAQAPTPMTPIRPVSPQPNSTSSRHVSGQSPASTSAAHRAGSDELADIPSFLAQCHSKGQRTSQTKLVSDFQSIEHGRSESLSGAQTAQCSTLNYEAIVRKMDAAAKVSSTFEESKKSVLESLNVLENANRLQSKAYFQAESSTFFSCMRSFVEFVAAEFEKKKVEEEENSFAISSLKLKLCQHERAHRIVTAVMSNPELLEVMNPETHSVRDERAVGILVESYVEECMKGGVNWSSVSAVAEEIRGRVLLKLTEPIVEIPWPKKMEDLAANHHGRHGEEVPKEKMIGDGCHPFHSTHVTDKGVCLVYIGHRVWWEKAFLGDFYREFRHIPFKGTKEELLAACKGLADMYRRQEMTLPEQWNTWLEYPTPIFQKRQKEIADVLVYCASQYNLLKNDEDDLINEKDVEQLYQFFLSGLVNLCANQRWYALNGNNGGPRKARRMYNLKNACDFVYPIKRLRAIGDRFCQAFTPCEQLQLSFLQAASHVPVYADDDPKEPDDEDQEPVDEHEDGNGAPSPAAVQKKKVTKGGKKKKHTLPPVTCMPSSSSLAELRWTGDNEENPFFKEARLCDQPPTQVTKYAARRGGKRKRTAATENVGAAYSRDSPARPSPPKRHASSPRGSHRSITISTESTDHSPAVANPQHVPRNADISRRQEEPSEVNVSSDDEYNIGIFNNPAALRSSTITLASPAANSEPFEDGSAAEDEAPRPAAEEVIDDVAWSIEYQW